ncbi:diacylglycerol/lipid kinase family protein [Sphingomonas abietis]|uniref:YegS/Rv2252/BmrU family lipid kinase n=1 Tax=Sphingomonas abietis TaxID=3012344 RepID=A0ABY7NTU6_9SPHN|nr:YegS/Rv2252/BmrU family lipid kinase [Sphingomonas abietis]WBO24210.1 YegS/Rv2252/BmrU family lipid kinase [Sphingomonas abietis]
MRGFGLCPSVTSPLPRSAALFVNAKSRKGRQSFEEARRLIEAAGIELSIARAIRKPSTMPACVRQAVADGVAMVIIGGGDGSISCSVDHVVGSDTVFAVLPLGTANSFARTLGIPLDLAGAVDVIAHGQARRIDLGMIDQDYFANCATLGIAPQIAKTVPHGLKAWLGRPGYLLWAAYKLARFKAFRLTVDTGDAIETLDAVEVRIANGPYHGGVELVDEAAVDSGQIVVQVVIGETRWSLVWSWLLSALRHRERRRTTREFEGQAIRLSTPRPMPISIDGEVLAKTPVTARVARRAILVAAPTPSPRAGS